MVLLDAELFSLSGSHSFYGGLAALWIFSAAVSAMDRPKVGDGYFYTWFYRFTHLLAANLDKVTVADLRCEPVECVADGSTQSVVRTQEK